MIHRYSFLTEKIALSLVELMMPKTVIAGETPTKTYLTDLSILDSCEGVVVWGFENKYTYNSTTKVSTLVF